MHWKERWTEVKLVVRPVWMAAVAIGGFWLGAYQLSLAPWHHLTFIWVFGFGIAAYGGYQAYRSIADRVCLAQWFDTDDATATAQLEDAETWAKRLPSRYRTRFHERRALLRRARRGVS